MENWKDGRIKMFVAQRLLHCRRENAGLFQRGDYVPLEAKGEFASPALRLRGHSRGGSCWSRRLGSVRRSAFRRSVTYGVIPPSRPGAAGRISSPARKFPGMNSPFAKSFGSFPSPSSSQPNTALVAPRKKRSALVIAYFLTWGVIPHILFTKKRPVSTLAWVWSIIALPFVGPIAYFMFGADRMQRKRLRKAARLGVLHRQSGRAEPEPAPQFSLRKNELLRVLGEINQLPFSTASHVQLLVDAKEFYPELERRIEDGAQPYPHRVFHLAARRIRPEISSTCFARRRGAVCMCACCSIKSDVSG